MISEDFAKRILGKAIRACPAEEVMAVINGGKRASTRFQGDYIHQNMVQKDYRLKVIARINGRTGTAISNDFDDTVIQNTAANAASIAQMQTGNSTFNIFPVCPEYPERCLYDKEIMDMPADQRAGKAHQLMNQARSDNMKASGYYSQGDLIIAFMNSLNDNLAYHVQTWDSISVTVENDQGGSGYGLRESHHIDLDAPDKAYEEALRTSRLNVKPDVIKPGMYKAVLSPLAANELVEYLIWISFGGLSYSEGTSLVSNRLGQRITGECVSIVDDSAYPETAGISFDYEGTEKSRLNLIEKGIAVSPALDHITGKSCGLKTTGHASAFPSSSGPYANHIRMLPGCSSIEELIKDVHDGIYISSFFYTNVTDPMKCSITTMTRNGTFRIRNGNIAEAVADLRINAEIPGLFSRIMGISSAGRGYGTFGRVWTPAIAVDGLCVTGTKRE